MSDFENFMADLEAAIAERNGFPQEMTEETAEDLLYDLAVDNHAHYCHGISKAVIVFDNDDCVIKIPFNGFYNDCWDEESEEYEETFVPFCCAMGTEWNYCQTEVNVYHQAEDAGVAAYFAETAFFKTIAGFPLYIQPKVINYEESMSGSGVCARNSYEDRRKTIQHCEDSGLYCGRLDSDWLTDFFNYWGQEALDNLLSFLEYTGVGDLHNENIGYFGQAPIILDYSDFMDCE